MLNSNQIRFIKENMNKISIGDLSKEFNVHRNAIVGTISNIKRNQIWTPEQDNFLIENKDKTTINEISQIIGKPIYTIFARLKRLGLKRKNFANTAYFKKGNIPHNEGKTKENYEPLMKVSKKIKLRFPNKKIKEKKIKWKRYFEILKEKNPEKLKEFGRNSFTNFKNLDKEKFQIIQKKAIEKYSEKRKNKYWKEEEINFLKENYLSMKDKDMAKILNKSLRSIQHKRRDFLRLSKGSGNRFVKGENNPTFNNWSSREPYGEKFSPELKEQIRERDNHQCQECGFTQKQLGKKLDVHHIDFNKNNNNPNNLISLCKSCHSQTQFNRQNWTNYFRNKIKEFI